MVEAAKVLSVVALLAGVASIHPKLRPAIYAAWIAVAGVALCLVGAAFQ